MHPTIVAIQKGNLKKVPEVRTGYTIEVSQKVTEGSKERVQKFKGLVIKIGHGAGVEKTFTVRKIVEGIGVEKTFPFHSPNIVKIHVIKRAKVRRQKLYYMRERFGKSARLSERHVTDEERATEEARIEALYTEAVKANEEKVATEESSEIQENAETTVTQNKEVKASVDQVSAESSAQGEVAPASEQSATKEEASADTTNTEVSEEKAEKKVPAKTEEQVEESAEEKKEAEES